MWYIVNRNQRNPCIQGDQIYVNDHSEDHQNEPMKSNATNIFLYDNTLYIEKYAHTLHNKAAYHASTEKYAHTLNCF